MTTINLPWPPSINHYWRRVGNRTLISKAGRDYRERVIAHVTYCHPRLEQYTGRLSVRIMAHAPDRRRRDLDNLPKAILDAVTHAGVWVDDEQIDDLHIVRGEVVTPGFVTVEVGEL